MIVLSDARIEHVESEDYSELRKCASQVRLMLVLNLFQGIRTGAFLSLSMITRNEEQYEQKFLHRKFLLSNALQVRLFGSWSYRMHMPCQKGMRTAAKC